MRVSWGEKKLGNLLCFKNSNLLGYYLICSFFANTISDLILSLDIWQVQLHLATSLGMGSINIPILKIRKQGQAVKVGQGYKGGSSVTTRNQILRLQLRSFISVFHYIVVLFHVDDTLVTFTIEINLTNQLSKKSLEGHEKFSCQYGKRLPETNRRRYPWMFYDKIRKC